MKINRPFMRQLAELAGYTVYQRSSHGPGPAWDWAPKGPMQSNHFRSKEAAWADLEVTMHAKVTEAEKLIRLCQQIIRQEVEEPTQTINFDAHVHCRPGWCRTAHVRYCPAQLDAH